MVNHMMELLAPEVMTLYRARMVEMLEPVAEAQVAIR